MFKDCFDNVRKNVPLVHNITNYVTVNDVPDIQTICGGLNINIGTLNSRTIESMFIAGRKANELGHPVLLDPVGAGASKLRTDTAVDLLKEIKFDVVRGNISEIKTLAIGSGTTKGVDADAADAITDETLPKAVEFLKGLAKKMNTIVAVTGAIDIVTDGEKAYVIRNGRKEMGQITGTGCQLSGLMTAFIVANPDNKLEAAAAAVSAMGLAGEIGYDNLAPYEGNSTYRNRIIDAICNMDGEQLEKGAKCQIM